MTYFTPAAVGAVLISMAGMAQATSVDFAGFNEGDDLSTLPSVNFGDGLVATVTQLEGIGAVIFDTAPGTVSTGNDSDLLGNVQNDPDDGSNNFVNAEDSTDLRDFGNVLIVQEDQSEFDPDDQTVGPDDRGAGGTLAFDFISGLISLDEVFLLDAAAGTVATLLLGDTVVESFTVSGSNVSNTGGSFNPNQFTLFDFDGQIGDAFFVDFAQSGALGEFNATSAVAVPVPASLPLLVGGFGVMAFLRRRRKAS